MSGLYVNTNNLSQYGNTLNTKVSELRTSRNKMENIMEDLKKYWGGSDASSFYKNGTEYLEYIKLIETLLEGYSGTIKNKSAGYDKRCEAFYSRLGE